MKRLALTDEQLMGRFAAGEEDAFSALYERYRAPLMGFLGRSVREEQVREDLLQETFLKVYEKKDSFAGASSFKTWLYTIALNKSRDRLRRLKVRRAVSLDATPAASGGNGTSLRELVPSGSIAPEAALEEREEVERMRLYLEALPADQREILQLVRFEELSYREAAEVAGCTVSAAKMRAHRALKSLAEMMRNAGR